MRVSSAWPMANSVIMKAWRSCTLSVLTFFEEWLTLCRMIKPAFVKILAVTGALLCAGCSTVDDGEGIAYKVKMRGADDWSIRREVKESAATWKLRKLPPSTLGQLQYRMEKDLETINDRDLRLFNCCVFYRMAFVRSLYRQTRRIHHQPQKADLYAV